ncbi:MULTISPECIES: L-cystine transporter [Janthinobacterium]|uniref:Cation:dicarboxylase symporter family transporter n=1 Tax=Janthinobacterium kumbetense TaxID=2950280 RepID=A0ABT0WXZ4_9BURK|nr:MULTISPECIES: cation:dicarboxylase symporter family transporter [Janthinobacterium]MCM2567871.1 cation:dicarboxylase symporter family transporter [Janthinobacterium kumbetense]MDN2678533.1 cation:dicarboxylase symporter family transporter [Janthinobacterium sp. SUN033]MDN2703532.1 cation:dicarboxylase symporter family transporter [Janthinobacterium sp. SUN100]MDO8041362.1 cation:dicarboxylase symporter family transporter [Janthinobacterium sp. SUN137]MDO8052298.1 cation:dicarboxylase sympor
MAINIILNLLVALIVFAFMFHQQRKHATFTVRVFTGLGLGVLLGAAVQWLYGAGSPIIAGTNEYIDIVGSGYVKLLQMIIMPLIMVSIISAILKLKDASSLGKISALTIGTLLITTTVAAALGILMAKLFGLTAVGLTSSAAEVARGVQLQGSLETAKALSLPKLLVSFVPTNPFLDMTGARKTSTIAVVVFSIFIGISATGIAAKKPEIFASFENFMKVAHAIVMRMVTLVLRLTPYGVFALMFEVVASSSYTDILKLINFVVASYSALILMFLVHLAIIAGVGLNPLRFVKKVFPVLAFAFTSRTSAGSIPMSVQTQTQRLGTPEGIANFAASFGSTIGQNGCAGIYPAMLAVMIAPTVGVDPFTISFLLPLLAIITIGSVGVAGVGGGATFAALIVLSAMDLPVALAGLLISVEPLIDMGRTALNVSGSITAGTVTSRVMGQTDLAVYNSDDAPDLDEAEHAA